MELYITSLREWFRHIIREPHKVMFISIIFVVLSLPVVTTGFAAAVCLNLARFDADGRGVKLKDVIMIHVKPVILKALIMGLFDIVLLLLTALCIIMLFNRHLGESLKIIYAPFLIIDMIAMMSAIYRYPILVYNESFKFMEVFVKGILITIRNLFKCILFTLVMITIFICSVLTGVGVLLLFAGAVAFLMIYIYKQTLSMEYGN